MKILFSVGPVNIHFFGVMIATGVITAYLLIMREARQKGMNTDEISNIIMGGILGIFIGARVGYILFYNFSYYLEQPLRIFMVSSGGLSVHGGIVGGLITVGAISVRSNKYNFRELAEMFAPPIVLAQGISRIGCDVYGQTMSQARLWGLEVGSLYVHPVQMYEFLLNYIFFTILWTIRKDYRVKGKIFGIYLIGYGGIRSTVELFRNNPLVFATISVSHLLSLAIVIVGLIYIFTSRSNKDMALANQDVSMYTPSLIIRNIIFMALLMSLSVMAFYYVQSNF